MRVRVQAELMEPFGQKGNVTDVKDGTDGGKAVYEVLTRHPIKANAGWRQCTKELTPSNPNRQTFYGFLVEHMLAEQNGHNGVH